MQVDQPTFSFSLLSLSKDLLAKLEKFFAPLLAFAFFV
jgi:hypothetical protein